MPNMIIPLVSVEQSIMYPIIYEVVDDIASYLKLDKGTARIYHNSLEVAKSDLKNNVIPDNDDDTPVTTSKARLMVNVRDEQNEDRSLGAGVVEKRDQFPIFRDDEVGVSIAPVYITTDLTFEFIYKSPSKENINRMRDHIRMNLQKTFNMINHRIEYTMLMSKFVSDFIDDVYTMKSRIFPMDKNEYINAFSDNRIHNITDMSNLTNSLQGVREKVVEVMGTFNLVGSAPDRDTDNSKNQHSISFTYNVTLEIPKALTINFPVMICNELISDKYIEALERIHKRKFDYHLDNRPNISTSTTIMSYFASHKIMDRSYSYLYPINIPVFDRDTKLKPIPGYDPIMTVLVNVNEDDRQSLFNLNELDPYCVSKDIIEYILSGNSKRVCRLYGSFVYFGLEQEGIHLSNDILSIDRDLNVKANKPLSLIRPVRVSINVCTDITFLDETCINEIYKDNKLFVLFLNEYLEVRRDMPRTTSNDQVVVANTLLSLVIRKLDNLMTILNFNTAREIMEVIEQYYDVSNHLAFTLIRGYPDLYKKLVNKRICVVNDSSRIEVVRGSTDNKNHQLRTGIKSLQNVENGLSKDELHNSQVSARNDTRMLVQRTAMINSIITTKE